MATTITVGPDGKASVTKRQGATLDYLFNWAPWLTALGVTIQTATFTCSDGLVMSDPSYTTTTATCFVSKGVIDTTEWLTCTIFGSDGKRIDLRTIFIFIKAR